MKSVKNIAELISRGLEEDQVAQKAVENIFQYAQTDPEFQEVFMDAASRLRDNRIQRIDSVPTEQIYEEIDLEIAGQKGPSEREAKLLRMVIEAKKRIKELEGGTGLRTGEAGAQGTGLPQGQRSPEARPTQGREGGLGQAGGRQGNRPQEL